MISRLEYLNENRGICLFTAAHGSSKNFALSCFAEKVNLNLTKVIYLCFTTVTTNEFYRQSIRIDKRLHYILMWNDAQYLNKVLAKMRPLSIFIIDYHLLVLP